VNKADEKYQPAVFKYTNKAGEEKVYNAEVKPRGKTRKEICVHPPLKLKIKKADLTQAGMLPFNEMKIVWECKPSGAFEQYLYKEFMAYRLYNRLTSASFRAKLLKINLVDTNSPTKVIEKIGFIVEDEEARWQIDWQVWKCRTPQRFQAICPATFFEFRLV